MSECDVSVSRLSGLETFANFLVVSVSVSENLVSEKKVSVSVSKNLVSWKKSRYPKIILLKIWLLQTSLKPQVILEMLQMVAGIGGEEPIYPEGGFLGY